MMVARKLRNGRVVYYVNECDDTIHSKAPLGPDNIWKRYVNHKVTNIFSSTYYSSYPQAEFLHIGAKQTYVYDLYVIIDMALN